VFFYKVLLERCFDDQFAFWPTGATNATFIALLHTLRTMLSTDHVFSFDFTKAFDTVRHNVNGRRSCASSVENSCHQSDTTKGLKACTSCRLQADINHAGPYDVSQKVHYAKVHALLCKQPYLELFQIRLLQSRADELLHNVPFERHRKTGVIDIGL